MSSHGKLFSRMTENKKICHYGYFPSMCTEKDNIFVKIVMMFL